jgi:hypothetical protein
VARLVASITPQKKRAWQEGNPRTWTWETHQLALSRVYGPLPQGAPPVLGDDYVGQATQLIEEQLAKAGVRLAAALHVIWP